MPFFFKEEKQQRVARKFPSRKQKLGTTPLGCTWGADIPSRTQHPLKKIRFQGGNFGHLLRRSGTALLLNRLSLFLKPLIQCHKTRSFRIQNGVGGVSLIVFHLLGRVYKELLSEWQSFSPQNSSTFKWLNFTILYLQILEYKNNEKVYNKNFWLADYCYVVLSAINFRPTLPFVQGIFDVFCYTKKTKNL